MKYIKAVLAVLAIAGICWLLLTKSQMLQQTRDRKNRSEALAAAAPEKIRARYVLSQAAYGEGPPDSEALHTLAETLRLRGWVRDADRPGLPLSWCAKTGKGAVYRHGWVWVSDSNGKVLKSVWFEPDLKADGHLEWSLDGTQLRLRADGWRHWLNLDMELK